MIGDTVGDKIRCEVKVVIIGYRNPADICRCLQALSRANPEPNFDVFICENGGIEAFQGLLSQLTDPQGPCRRVDDDWSESLFADTARLEDVQCLSLKDRASRVWIGRAPQNLGYAGAINSWVECLSCISGWEGIWILNPDTEPEPDALSALVERAISGNKGMVGSTIVPANDRKHVQCRGGHRWRKLKTKLGIIGFREPVDQPIDLSSIERALDSISGASMYVARRCLEQIGPMDERFFLYYEDADWSARARRYGLGYAPEFIIPHRGGSTIGSASRRTDRSELSVYLENRNRIHFVRKHWNPYFLLASVLGLLYALEYLFVGSHRNFIAAINGLIAGIRGEIGPPRTPFRANRHIQEVAKGESIAYRNGRTQFDEVASTPRAPQQCRAVKPKQIRSREIRDDDCGMLAEFLGNGLGYSNHQFQLIFQQLAKHSTPEGFPRYGYVLESDDKIVGAILLIFSRIWSDGVPRIRCHVTSWCVEPDFRTYATLFTSKALSHKDVIYINTSARPETRRIIEAQGFATYSHGQFVAIPALQFFSRCGNDVRIVEGQTVPNVPFDPHDQDLLLAHARYGCISMWIITSNRAYPFVFQQRWFKGLIPGVQLIFCRDVEDFVRFARPIGLFLASRGMVLVRIDANGPIRGLIGKYTEGMEPRFYKGLKPRVGDLAYTQTVMCPYVRRNSVALH